MVIIDTNIAIHLRDADPEIGERLRTVQFAPAISVITLIELEAGVYREPDSAAQRRLALLTVLPKLEILPFTRAEADAYGAIIATLGYTRARVLDRMIAAQAIVAGTRLITINRKDFADIPGLDLEVWPSP